MEEKNFFCPTMALTEIFLLDEPASGWEGARTLGGYSGPKVKQLYGHLEMLLWTLKHSWQGLNEVTESFLGYLEKFLSVLWSRGLPLCEYLLAQRPKIPKISAGSDDLDPTHRSIPP